ncbi:hypothetical protein PBSP11A_000505500 [Plasmodium berghei]|uniref:Uncharacterized protein n=1 Tax=Plasmodium berghei TaxID=5821 RepID=A0A1D3L7M7_PLABE|nr:hypothetical protein PBSP11A_000505500 [Plasmodium berghei]
MTSINIIKRCHIWG